MKTIRRNLDEIGGTELGATEQKVLKGGAEPVGREEYCTTLCFLFQNNWNTWTLEEQQSFINAWYAHCNGYGYTCDSVPSPS
jgi:hypothetical protein